MCTGVSSVHLRAGLIRFIALLDENSQLQETSGQWVLTKDRSTFQALFLGIWAGVEGHPMFLIWGNNLYLEPPDEIFYTSMRYA